MNTFATCHGVGRLNGWTWKASTPSHQTAISTASPRTGSSTAPSRPSTRRRMRASFRAAWVRGVVPRTRARRSALRGQPEIDEAVRGQPGRDRVRALHQRDAAGDPLLVQRADRGTGTAGVHLVLDPLDLA